MFIDNKYYKWYSKLILHAQSKDRSKGLDVYYENHHVIPKSCGGTDDADNLTLLTAREHYIAHLLLTKCTKDKAYKKMMYALHRIVHSACSEKEIRTSRLYQYLRENHAKIVSDNMTGRTRGPRSDETKKKISKANKGRKLPTNSEETRRKKSNSAKGKIKSEEHRKNLSDSIKGKTHTEITKQKISKNCLGKKNGPMPAEQRLKISKALKGKTRKKMKQCNCPHCDKCGSENNMKRWHFDNCKIKRI